MNPIRRTRRVPSAGASTVKSLVTETLFENGKGSPAIKPRVLSDLADGEQVSAPFVVRERELRQKKNGEDFLRLVLGDRSGTVPAIGWDRVAECFEAAKPGAIVIVGGRFSVHPQFGKQIKLASVRPAEPGEYDADEMAEGPVKSLDRLESELRELLETIQHSSLRALLDCFFGPETDAWQRFREAPAAKHYHQAYQGGLLEHTVSVAQAVSAAANFFPGVDREIAVTGALLHDIGKTEAYNDDPLAIDLTDAGRLNAEIPLGYYRVRRQIEEIEGFDHDLAQAILHIVLSHHGQLEHGSPVVPCTREATLVHALDNLGGKLGSFDRLERELADGESWSRFDRGIESAAYFGSRAA
jgi:3'-5' exoribonuclease